MPGTPAITRELRDRALSHHRAGNLGAAISAYESLLSDHPDDADCLGLLALALHQSGERDAARGKWLQSLPLPADPYIQLRNLNNLIAAGIESGLAADAETWTQIKVPDWPVARRPAEAEKDLVISLGRALLKIGKGAEAVRLIDSTVSFTHGDLIVARNFAEILIEAGTPEKAHRLLTDITGMKSHGNEERLLALAATAHAAGLDDEAARLTKEAIAALPVYITRAEPGQQFLIGVLNPAPQIVNKIMSPQLFHFSGNSPASLAWRLNHLYRFWSVFPEAPEAAAALDTLPRPRLILNNWVNAERLSTSGTLDFISSFADHFDLPVLNHPHAAAQVTRQRNAERLAGIPGLVVPRVARFRNEPAQRERLVRSIAEDFGFPVIIRNTYMQGGKEAEKITSAAELATHLDNAAHADLYAIEFISNPVAGSFFRKIRAAVIGDEVIVAHVHFGERWNVHRERNAGRAAERLIPPAEQALAQAILFKPDETLGKSGIAALRAIKERIPLDFYGIDFDLLPDGRLVFFEANATMNVSLTDRKGKGLEPIRARMRESFHRLLEQTAAKGTGGDGKK